MQWNIKEFFYALLGSGVINLIITHILYNKKLKKDLKNMGNDLIAKKIQESLEFVRNVELQLDEIEVFEAESRIKNEEYIDFFGGKETIYLSVFNNFKALNGFLHSVKECRKNHEKNLNCKIALNLAYIERYLLKLISFINSNGGEEYLQFWGTIFIFDLQRWQRKIDKLIIKEINKHNYKLEFHGNKKWHILRKKEIEKQYEDSFLFCLCEQYDNFDKAEKKNFIMSVFNDYVLKK